MRVNPASIAQKQRADEVVRLRQENEKLRQAIEVLEEKQGEVEDLTAIVGTKVHQPSQSKEIEGKEGENKLGLSWAKLSTAWLAPTRVAQQSFS